MYLKLLVINRLCLVPIYFGFIMAEGSEDIPVVSIKQSCVIMEWLKFRAHVCTHLFSLIFVEQSHVTVTENTVRCRWLVDNRLSGANTRVINQYWRWAVDLYSLKWSYGSSPIRSSSPALRATDCGRHMRHDEEVQIQAHDPDPGAPL